MYKNNMFMALVEGKLIMKMVSTRQPINSSQALDFEWVAHAFVHYLKQKQKMSALIEPKANVRIRWYHKAKYSFVFDK